MKLQELTESLKVGLDEQSTLRSKLIDTTKLIEKFIKEIQVNDSNYICNNSNITRVCSYVPIHLYVRSCKML